MLHPASIRAENLTWTRHGVCWALWQLHGMSYGLRPTKDKIAVRAAHQAMLRCLSGESMLLSVVVAQDPVSIVQRMIEDVDLEQRPAWAEEAEARLDSLEDTQAGDRLYFLAVPLPNPGIRKLTLPAAATLGTVKAHLGLPHHGVGAQELEYRRQQAKRVESLIPRTFTPRRVSVAQQVWLDYHLEYRGIDATGYSREDLDAMGPVRHIGEAILDEGGKSDDEGRGAKLNPFNHRYVKVGDEDLFAQGAGSYQAMFALTGLPPGGLMFPGSEILGDIDSYIPGADWVMRLRGRSSDAAKRANKTAMVRINDQVDQRQNEQGTGMHDLDAAIDALTEYDRVLQSDRNEIELQPVIIFAVCSDSAEDVRERSQAAVDTLRGEDFQVVFPAGYQEDLWWAFTPGTVLSRKLGEFAQITTSRDLSGLVPITVAQLGDSRGALLAENHTSQLPSMVYLDLPGMIRRRDKSGCIGVTGELGSGKSTTMKIIMKAVVDCWGGQIVATDRSETGEWATYVSTLTDPAIVDPYQPQFSMDPLRTFDADRGATMALNFLVILLDMDVAGPMGALLGEVLSEDYLREHDLGSMRALLDHLEKRREDGDKVAGELRQHIGIYASKPFARALFDESLPALPWQDAKSIVIRTNRLELPKETELNNPSLYRTMRIEKRFGRAMYTLITTLARMVCLADPNVLGVYFEDEAHNATSNDLQVAELELFVRDGRKHFGLIVLGSHDPEADFGGETLRGLITIRIVHRQTDKALAQKSLRWIGLDETDEEMVDALQNHTSPQIGDDIPVERRGEAYLRDAAGTIGRIRTLLPAQSASREAASTTPKEATDSHA